MLAIRLQRANSSRARRRDAAYLEMQPRKSGDRDAGDEAGYVQRRFGNITTLKESSRETWGWKFARSHRTDSATPSG